MENRIDHNSDEIIAPVATDELVSLRIANELLRNQIKDLMTHISELKLLADSDELTSLPNRRCFMRELERVSLHVTRYKSGAAVLFVDVDGLKKINDTHGHCGGDTALVHIGQLLRSTLRATDLVARIGGDEFGLLIDPIEDMAVLKKIAVLTKLVRTTPVIIGGVSTVVDVSMGYTMIRIEDQIGAIMNRADEAMYGEKRAHRSAR